MKQSGDSGPITLKQVTDPSRYDVSADVLFVLRDWPEVEEVRTSGGVLCAL